MLFFPVSTLSVRLPPFQELDLEAQDLLWAPENCVYCFKSSSDMFHHSSSVSNLSADSEFLQIYRQRVEQNLAMVQHISPTVTPPSSRLLVYQVL